MKRDINRLRDGPFDVLVIGGGIYGAWTAYDAALRGLKVALVEKSDWASGTSSASSKLIHGGLRYLERFRFGMVKKSLDERRRLAQLAPHRVTPRRFLLPVYSENRVGRSRLKAGLMIYDWLARGDQPVDKHESLTYREVIDRYPHLNKVGLIGGFTYGDCQMDDALFTLEIIEGADRAGAVVVNHVEATELLTTSLRVNGAVVMDGLGDETLEVRASVVVNTAGPWLPQLSIDSTKTTRIRMSKGVHIVMPPLGVEDAMLVTARQDNRVVFVIPWYGKTLVGTTDADFEGNLDDVRVDEYEIEYLLDEVNAVIEKPRWNRSDVAGRFAGVRALKYQPGKPPAAITREWVLESPGEGLLVSVGGKFTSARTDASEIVDRILRMMGKPPTPSPTDERPFPWCPSEPFSIWLSDNRQAGIRRGMDPGTAELTACRYGSLFPRVLDLLEREPGLAGRLHPDFPFCRAEIVLGVEHGMAITLEDLLRRRVPILILDRIKRSVVEDAADLAAPILGWGGVQRANEIDQVLERWSA